jgi:opacity protein-like surface antigen
VAAEVDGHYGSADLSWSVRHGQEIGSVTYTGSAASESRAYSFLLGPRLYLAERGGLRPFAQVLLGAVRWTVKTAGEYNVAGSWIARGTFTDDASGVGFATAIGGGADIRLSQRISLRVIQVDYHMARLGLKHRYSVVQEPSGDSASKVVEDPTEPLHNLRLTFGLVFRMAK